MPLKYKKGEKVRFKKKHPCGGYIWEILRIGMDFKLECKTCGRIISLPRKKFEKAVKEKINNN